MRKITRPTIIITSLGRTGTMFFSEFFNRYFVDIMGYHEPDVIPIVKNFEDLQKFMERLKWHGLRYFTGKMKGESLRQLSNKRMAGKISKEQAAELVAKIRSEFINSAKGRYYLECNKQYYGLIDVIPEVFRWYRLIYIVRDGRDWVRSEMNVGYRYGNTERIFSVFGNYQTITPELIDDYCYKNAWRSMSRFEKLCWYWKTLNEYTLNSIENNSWARCFRFEDLFKSENRGRNLLTLVKFVLGTRKAEKLALEILDEALAKRVNASPNYDFPRWDQWNSLTKAQFKKICQDTMSKLGYGNEPEW